MLSWIYAHIHKSDSFIGLMRTISIHLSVVGKCIPWFKRLGNAMQHILLVLSMGYPLLCYH